MPLKWSRFKKKVSNFIIETYALNLNKVDKTSDKILIITLDALGDNLIKTKTIEIISEYYGKEKVAILCKDKWASIYKKLGYRTYIDEYKNTIKRAKLYRKLTKENYKKIIYFKHDLTEKQEYFFDKDKILEQIMDKEYNYILEQHIDLLKKITGKDYKIDEIRPDIKQYFNNINIKNIISIGIGASNRIRTLPVKNMIEIIKFLMEKYPDKKIILLGSGKKQVDYVKEIIKVIKNENILNKVDKLSLIETLEIVANSDLFVGYDSGLTNAAFSFKTKYICLHWGKTEMWWHKFENCVTLIGDGKNIEKDRIYGTDILNSIRLNQIEEGLNKLKIEN